ncbi:MAG TPA: methylmalonyl Co-A mutase-associated GTPase MeaB, partial [Anseongella sp.]|nr:methylmalonyl Co-A mutase-associated GTPase MeaB [Anseongella sp.]
VVLVPEAGDEIQSLKSGLMEVADIFVVNKSDREGARELAIVLQRMLHDRPADGWQVPVLQATANKTKQIGEIIAQIQLHGKLVSGAGKPALMAERAYRLISRKRMRNVSREDLVRELSVLLKEPGFNLYRYVEQFGQGAG